MRTKLIQALRRLAVSILYFVPVTLAVTSISINYASFAPTILILTSVGTTLWGIASIHSLSRNSYLLYKAIKDDDEVENSAQPIRCVDRGSTHSIFNNFLHINAAALYIAVDALLLDSSPIIITRLTGTILWEKSVLISMMLAFLDERRKENNPNTEVKIIGLPVESYRFICNLDFLVAGVLYAYGIFSLNNNFRKGYVCSWLAASIIDCAFDMAALIEACKEQADDPEDVMMTNRRVSLAL